MTNTFLRKKLNRAVWVSLANEGKLEESINTFEKYLKQIVSCKDINSIKLVKEEICNSIDIFSEKLKKLSEKYYKEKNYSNALKCYKYIYNIKVDDKENIINYINCLDTVEQFDLMLELALELCTKDDNPENYKLLSKAYEKNNNFRKSIEEYHRYLKLVNKKELDQNDYNNLGCKYFNSYTKCGENPIDAKNALESFKNALKSDFNSKQYLRNTMFAAMKAKDFETEKECWQKYFEMGYNSTDDEFTYCASCMRNGDIEGWKKHYISRFTKNEPTIYPKLSKPEWTGKEDLSNSTLLVHYEQGYGDNFLMWGYMSRLIKIAKKVIYYIQNNAYELLKDNEFGVEVYCHKTTDLKTLEYDYHIPCMSIPIALDLTKETLPVGGGYIKANPNLVKEYKDKYFNTKQLKVGVAFEGVKANQKRDIPVNTLKMLDDVQGIELYCLTKDVKDETLKVFKNNKVINVAKHFNNFADTAAAIENTDIIISSDNCILNLAGAMGKDVIGIFNYHYEFRWYDLSGNDSGWYTSVKPIVNNSYNDWDLSMKKAIEEIKKLIH